MKYFHCFFVFFLILLSGSCGRGMKGDYATSMSQCMLMIARLEQYEEINREIPTESQLADFMKQKKDDPGTFVGWRFSQDDGPYFARKNFVTMDSGKEVDIVITKQAEFLIIPSKGK